MNHGVWLLVFFGCFHLGFCILPGIEPACVVGDIIQNNKTKCLCIDKSIYECFIITNGTKITGYTNQVPTNDDNQLTVKDDKSVIRNFSEVDSCIPEGIYVQGNTTCVCTQRGTWPHKTCLDLFGILLVNPKNFTKCSPHSYVIVGCNVCYCNSDGRIDNTRCTKKDCTKDTVKLTRRSFENNCVPKTWYSLSACQFCYCAEANKLVCNTGRFNSKRLELGTYNLTVCGSKFLEEAMELMPDEQHLRNMAAKTTQIVKAKDRPVLREKSTKQTKPSTTGKQKNTSFTKTTLKPRDDEYYSDEDESSTHKIITTKASKLTTQQILSENEDNLPSYDNPSNNKPKENKAKKYELKNKDNNYDTKNSMQEDELAYKEQYVDSVLETSQLGQAKSKNYENIDDTQFDDKGNKSEPLLTINIPSMISKVFNLRRAKGNATVILKETKGKPCKPGYMTNDGCNKCFCLKSGKQLCTDTESC